MISLQTRAPGATKTTRTTSERSQNTSRRQLAESVHTRSETMQSSSSTAEQQQAGKDHTHTAFLVFGLERARNQRFPLQSVDRGERL